MITLDQVRIKRGTDCPCCRWFWKDWGHVKTDYAFIPFSAIERTRDSAEFLQLLESEEDCIAIAKCPDCGRMVLEDVKGRFTRWMSEIDVSNLPDDLGGRDSTDGYAYCTKLWESLSGLFEDEWYEAFTPREMEEHVFSGAAVRIDGWWFCRDYGDYLVFYNDIAMKNPVRAWQLRRKDSMRRLNPSYEKCGGYTWNPRMAYLDMLDGVNLDEVFEYVDDEDIMKVIDDHEFAIWHEAKVRYFTEVVDGFSYKTRLCLSERYFVRYHYDSDWYSYTIWLNFRDAIRPEVCIGRYCFGSACQNPTYALITNDEEFCVVYGCGVVVYRLAEPYECYEFGKKSSQWRDILRKGKHRAPERYKWVLGVAVGGDILVVKPESMAERYYILDDRQGHKFAKKAKKAILSRAPSARDVLPEGTRRWNCLRITLTDGRVFVGSFFGVDQTQFGFDSIVIDIDGASISIPLSSISIVERFYWW